MTDDELTEMIKRHAIELGEHFEAVLILAGKSDDDNNNEGLIIQSGRGMPCARIGLATAYLTAIKQRYRDSGFSNDDDEDEDKK